MSEPTFTDPEVILTLPAVAAHLKYKRQIVAIEENVNSPGSLYIAEPSTISYVFKENEEWRLRVVIGAFTADEGGRKNQLIKMPTLHAYPFRHAGLYA